MDTKEILPLIPRHAPAEFELPGGFSVRVAVEHDPDIGPPWQEYDGHGPVREGLKESKRAGERVLGPSGTRDVWYLYDFAEACKIARRDGWGSAGDESLKGRAKAARAAEADFEYLRRWCADLWYWCYVDVRVTAPDGTEARSSCGGLESEGDYWREVAADLTADALHELKEAKQAADVRRCFVG